MKTKNKTNKNNIKNDVVVENNVVETPVVETPIVEQPTEETVVTEIPAEEATPEQIAKVLMKSSGGHKKEKAAKAAKLAQSIADKIRNEIPLEKPKLSPVEKAKAKIEMTKINFELYCDRTLERAIKAEELQKARDERYAEIQKLVAEVKVKEKAAKQKANEEKIARKIANFNKAKENKSIPKKDADGNVWTLKTKRKPAIIAKDVDLGKYMKHRDEAFIARKKAKAERKREAMDAIRQQYGDHFTPAEGRTKDRKKIIAAKLKELRDRNAQAAREAIAARLEAKKNFKAKVEFEKLTEAEQIALKRKEGERKARMIKLEEAKTQRKIDRMVNKDLQIMKMLKGRVEALKHFNEQEAKRAEKRALKEAKYSSRKLNKAA